jgi:hypothetical protein
MPCHSYCLVAGVCGKGGSEQMVATNCCRQEGFFQQSSFLIGAVEINVERVV